MGNQIITQPQIFKTNTVVVGSAAGAAAVTGLTVYGDISASGTIHGIPNALSLSKSSYTQPGTPNITLTAGTFSSNPQNHLVYFDGVMQEYGVDYTISGNTLTTTAVAGTKIVVIALK